MKTFITLFIGLITIMACNNQPSPTDTSKKTSAQKEQKMVVYQVFTRLFGNTNTTNKPWGTLEENGVGKFEDFNNKALKEIKDLGVTHIWYTGVLHHATVTDYTQYGISNDDPDVVKGRAGSPYAVKDYYQVNPDLAVDPSKRLEEFEALIERSHTHGLKVIIDIIPNHIARHYEGKNNPPNVNDFGANDDTSVVYQAENNFYYIVGKPFEVPQWENGYLPLGGEKHPLADHQFEENPAKWTGNGSRSAQPSMHDWYETVKINYGITPQGEKDFVELPKSYAKKSVEAHYQFWKDKEVPNSWIKFRDIALFWIDKGVDGFRFDMAEMVPVEFWSYLNSAIKAKNKEAFLLAEVYNPHLYRDYIQQGKMDYLYDKVGLYDTIKRVMQNQTKTKQIASIQDKVEDIEHHMLHFLENHDEQRIASPQFAGNALIGKPAMVVSATISTSPTLIYFGQEVGEPGAENAGFGKPSRTSIFDYIGVPQHQKWVNNKLFDGGQLSASQKELRDFYKRLLNFTIQSDALMGEYQEIHQYNLNHTSGYNNRVFSFVRWNTKEKVIIVTNFDNANGYRFKLKLPKTLIDTWQIKNGKHVLEDQLYHQYQNHLDITEQGDAYLDIDIKPLESFILKLSN